ncbi:MAG: proton-conducting transporter membrane subunit [Cytophagales bacterium]
MEHSFLGRFLTDINTFSPELTLFFGFFVQLITLALPQKYARLNIPFGYITWAFFALFFFYNGFFNTVSFSGNLKSDNETYAVILLIFLSTILLLFHIQESEHPKKSLIFTLFNGLALGCILLVKSNSYFVFIISLEVVSLASYSLANFSFDKSSSSSSIKYYILGACGTAATIFGISWIYGISGSLYFLELKNNQALLSIALILLSVGLLFKIASFPMHFWASTVYENAPNVVLSILSTLPKIAGAYVLIKLFRLYQTDLLFSLFLASCSIITILIGTAGAIIQTNFKKMMGYSSIANSGFFLATVLLNPENQLKAFWIFAAAQVISNLGIFFSIDAMKFETYETNKWQGLGKKNLLLSITLLVSLLSLVGLPPLAGFTGKFLTILNLFSSQVLPQFMVYTLVSTLILSTLFSLYFYMMPIYRLLVQENTEYVLPVRYNWLNVIFATLIIVSLIMIFFRVGELGNYIDFKNE